MISIVIENTVENKLFTTVQAITLNDKRGQKTIFYRWYPLEIDKEAKKIFKAITGRSMKEQGDYEKICYQYKDMNELRKAGWDEAVQERTLTLLQCIEKGDFMTIETGSEEAWREEERKLELDLMEIERSGQKTWEILEYGA